MFTGGGGDQKMVKKLFAGAKSWKKSVCKSFVQKKFFCLHGNFKEFATSKIPACSKDAFLLQLTRHHSLTFGVNYNLSMSVLWGT